jgi:hypothetical protein
VHRLHDDAHAALAEHAIDAVSARDDRAHPSSSASANGHDSIRSSKALVSPSWPQRAQHGR